MEYREKSEYFLNDKLLKIVNLFPDNLTKIYIYIYKEKDKIQDERSQKRSANMCHVFGYKSKPDRKK